MNIYEAIKTNSSRFQVLKKLDKLFQELSEIDYGDREDSPRYGNMEPGLNEQSTISEEIKNLVQDNNITKEEFTEVFEPYKYGINISFEDYEYQPKHAKKEEIKEAQLIVPESTDDGWGEDIRDLTTDFFDLTDQVDYEIKNARRGSYGIDGTEVSDLAKAFNDISDKALEISETLSNATVDYSSDEDEEEE